MRRLEALREYGDLVQNFKEAHATVWTNCYLHPDAVAGHIAKKRLRTTGDNENLLFFVAEEACERLYFFTASADAVSGGLRAELKSISRRIAIDLVVRGADVENAMETKWLRSGFLRRSVYQRMTVAASTAAESPAAQAAAQNGARETVCTEDTARIPEIIALWRQCLDPLSVARPDAEELRALMARGRVRFMIRDGTLCAVMLSIRGNKKATIDHVAVHPSFRRQGLAHILLLDTVTRDLRDGTEEFRLWVDRENEAAVRLYRAFGFVPDNTWTVLLTAGGPKG